MTLFFQRKQTLFSATSTFHHHTKKPTKCLKGGMPSYHLYARSMLKYYLERELEILT